MLFRTTGCDPVFFKFGVNELKAIAPSNANAYFFVGEPTSEDNDFVCMVQYYRIKADTSKQLVHADKLAHDYDTMMELVAKEAV